MTPKQRYRATLAGQPVDHLARLPILMQFAAEHISSNYGAFASDYLPRQQRLVKGLKEMGAKVRMHICGNITHLLPGLDSLELDVLDVAHMVSLSRVREVCGRKVTICGNLDPVRDVLRGTPESIRAGSEACYDEVGNPFMVNAGYEIPSRTPVENLQALCTPVAWKA
ncbi:MAG: uroporphyrinogen decarboxylase family protein [Akkermansiaceae bacterium]